MTAHVLMVPPIEAEPWPTLGPQVVEWMEQNLVFGPGDLRGEPIVIDDDWFALICRAYEIFPQLDARGDPHPLAGKRRFNRVCWSLAKGQTKTEKLALISACELHPDAPVRFSGWDGHGKPATGRGVTDPYIPLVAYTEEQSDELAYAALKAILEESPVGHDFDIGLERIIRKRGDGRAVSLAAAPNPRDGARTTFQGKDETHRWTLPSLRLAHRTMSANLAKRPLADPWELETTTAFAIGEDSVGEATYAYAKTVADGKIKEPRLFYYHRQADPERELDSRDAIREAVIQASLPASLGWRNVSGIVDLWDDPQADHEYLDRVYCNRTRAGSGAAFDLSRWDETLLRREIVDEDLVRLVAERLGQEPDLDPEALHSLAHQLGLDRYVVPEKAEITVGFDGARYFDSTAFVGTELATGFQWTVACWERPSSADKAEVADWEVPKHEVQATVEEIFRRWRVKRMYCDPFHWRDEIDRWCGQYGEAVVEWRTNRYQLMSYACRDYATALKAGEIPHGEDPQLRRHLGAAVKQLQNFRDDKGERLWVIVKERPDSVHKIDLAVAAVLSRKARQDAIADGALNAKASVYERRGPVILGRGQRDDG